MQSRLLVFLLLAVCTGACSLGGSNSDGVTVVPRDSTITDSNAYTRLMIDSAVVQQYLQKEALSDSMSRLITSFYNSRNYQYAWFTEDGRAEHASAFWDLYKRFLGYTGDSLLRDARMHEKIDLLMSGDYAQHADPATLREAELRMTRLFFEHAKVAYEGRVDPESLQWHIPRKRVNATELLDSLLRGEGSRGDSWEPLNSQYRRLREKLEQYYEIRRAGGWDSILVPDRNKLVRGDRHPAIPALRRRLELGGFMQPGDTGTVFTAALDSAVRKAQQAFGLRPDGEVGKGTLAALNTPVDQRIEQMLINLERMRWLPEQHPGRQIIANIPSFTLHVLDSGRTVLDMKIVVGREGTSSVVFSDSLKYVVFGPYWNIPPSIVRNEILPMLRRDTSYLTRNNMEQVGTKGGLPVLRQRPGADNPLGKVKFIFPNHFNIYLHDTPAKSYFQLDKRAFSHGCIRVEKPLELAQYLLEPYGWEQDSVRIAMDTARDRWVTLPRPVPVFITYFTAWVDASGQIQFRDDIYGHDARLAERLFRREE